MATESLGMLDDEGTVQNLNTVVSEPESLGPLFDLETKTDFEQNTPEMAKSDPAFFSNLLEQTVGASVVYDNPLQAVRGLLVQQAAGLVQAYQNAPAVAETAARIPAQFYGAVLGSTKGLTIDNAASAVKGLVNAVGEGEMPSWDQVLQGAADNWFGGIKNWAARGDKLVTIPTEKILPGIQARSDAMMIGMSEYLATLGTDLGDYVLEKTGSPVAATAARMIPDTALAFFGYRTLKPVEQIAVAPKPIADVQALAAMRMGEGKLPMPFGGMKIEEWPVNLNEQQFSNLVQARAEAHTLVGQPRTVETQARMTELQDIISALEDKQVLTVGNNRLSQVDPDAVIAMASAKQQVSMTQKQIDRAMNGDGREVVIHYDEMGVPTLKSGLAEAIVAKQLGMKEVPIRQVFSGKLPKEEAVEAAGRAQAYFDASRAMSEKIDGEFAGLSMKNLTTKFFDRSHEVKRIVEQAGGELGHEAVMSYEMAAGANPSAMYQFDKYLDRTFRGLNEPQTDILNNVIRSRNAIEVDAFRKSRGKKEYQRGFVSEKGTTKFSSADARGYLQELRAKVGDAEMKNYEERASNYFEAMHDLLKMRLEEGLITVDDFDAMLGLDYVHAKYLEVAPDVVKMGGKKLNVAASGVEPLGSGQMKLLDMRADQLMKQQTIGVFRKSFENRATKDLSMLAFTPEGQKYVKWVDKAEDVPQGMDVLNFMDHGTRQMLAVDPIIARQWKYLTKDMTQEAVNAIRTLTLVTPTKLANVGLNPTFFLRDAPRNLMHAFLAAGTTASGKQVFSRDVAMYGLQLGKSMMNTAESALTRSGKQYEDLVKGGGMPGLMSHIGRQETGWLDKNFPNLMKTLSYGNDTSEIWMRLAIMDRAKMMGMSNKEAIHTARQVLDYAQAGTWSYAWEQFIPFFNANMQAWYSMGRGVKRDPSRLASLGMYTALGAAALGVKGYFYNPDAWDAIDDTHLVNGFNMVLPPSMNTTSSDGTPMYGYMHVPVNSEQMPFVAAGNWLAQMYTMGRKPDSLATETMRQMLPVQTWMPPAMSAMLSFNNFDAFSMRKIYEGEGIAPYAEYRAGNRYNFTPQMYKDISEWLVEKGLGEWGVSSPERLRHAAHNILGQNPMFAGIEIFGNEMFGEEPQALVNATKQEQLMRLMKLSGVVKTGSGMSGLYDEGSDPIRTQSHLNNKTVENLFTEWKNGNVNLRTGIDILSKMGTKMPTQLADAEERLRLVRRFTTSVELQQISKMMKPSNSPPQSWWLSLANSPPRQAATRFYNYWETKDAATQRDLVRYAHALKGLWNKDAEDQFRYLQKQAEGK